MSISDVFKSAASKAIQTVNEVVPPVYDANKVEKRRDVKVRIKLSDGRFARATINGNPDLPGFEDKVDAAKRDIEDHLGLNKQSARVAQPAPVKQPIRGGSEAILGGTIFDPSRKPQQPQQPVRKATPKEESEQATRNVLRTKSGPEFRQAVKKQGDAINRAALSDVRPSNEGNPALVGDEGIGSVAKKLGGKDPFKQFQQVVGTAARTVGGAVSPALKLDNARDQKILDTATAELLGVPGSPEEVVLNLGLAALGPLALRVAGAALKARPKGTMRDIAEMIFSEEGRTALKQSDPSVAAAVDIAPNLVREGIEAKDPVATLAKIAGADADAQAFIPAPRETRAIGGPVVEPQPAPVAQVADDPIATLSRIANDETVVSAPVDVPAPKAPEVPPNVVQPSKAETGVIEPEGTSIKNASVNRDRAQMDLSELPEPERKTFVGMIDEARAKGDSDPARVLDRARKINSDAKPTPLSDVESAGFTDVLNGLKNDYDATIKKIQNTSDPAELAKLSDDIDRIRNDFDEITIATKRSGTEAARALVARKITIDRDYSPLSLRAEAKAIVAKAGAELSPEQAKRIDELGTKIKELEDRVAKTEAENVTLKQQAEEAFSLTLREPKGRSARQSPAVRARTRQEAIAIFRAANEKLAKAQLSKLGAAPDVTAYAEYIKEIAPAVTTLVKSYIDEGIDVLDSVVRKVLDDFDKEGLPIKEDDILDIIAGKRTEQKPLAERTKTILRFRAEAKKIVDADVIKARRAEVEAKKIANAEARKKAQLEARKATQEALDRQKAEAKAWRDQQLEIKKDETEARRANVKSGKIAARQMRESYVSWWNDTAPAEAESLMRKIERQVERQAVTEAPLPKAKAKQFKENEALRIELEAERVKADRYLQELREEAERSKVPKALQVIGDFANPRNIKASFDLSAPFNQGLLTLFTNPKAWANSTVSMFRSLGKGGLVNEVARIRTSPYYKKALAGKLAISETGSIGPNEQRLGKTVFDKLPGFSKSNDAYAAFTQTARMRMFESLAKKLEAPRVNWIESAKTGKIVKTEGGTLSLDEYKDLAEYVNTVTGAGRGELATALNKVRFFAGGYTVSRFQTALGQPIIKAAIKKNPALAREVIKDYAKFATAASSGYALLTAMGYEVDSDIRSPTFMQVKQNGRWIDPFGGIFKPLILISRMSLGSKDENKKKVQGAQPESTFGYFVAGKQEPISRAGLSIIKGQSFGKDTSIGSAEGIKNLAMGLYAPIFVEQAIETFNDKTLTPEQQTALSIAQLFGVQMNRDEKKKIDKRVAKPLADVLAPMATKIGETKSNVNERLKGLIAPRK